MKQKRFNEQIFHCQISFIFLFLTEKYIFYLNRRRVDCQFDTLYPTEFHYQHIKIRIFSRLSDRLQIK